MRGLIVCIAVVCLAFATGAPSDEKSKVYTKNFNYDKKNVIYSLIPLYNDELVYAVCEGSGDEKKCKVYVDSSNQDQNIVQSCDLNLKYTGKLDFQVHLFNAGNSRAVIVISDSGTKFNVFSINLKDCRISKEVSFVGEPRHPTYPEVLNIEFAAHENNYDIFFQNKNLCHDFYCTATIDYEGKVVKTVSEFPLKYDINTFHRIASTDHAHLIGQMIPGGINVYLVNDGDKEPNKLYSGSQYSFIGLSTEENKLGFCTHHDRKLVCKQYDIEGKNKIIEISNPTGQRSIEYLDILNLEKGFLALMAESRKSSGDRVITVIHFDEQGKQGKYVNFSVGCDENQVILLKSYKNSNGQYCVNSICFKLFDSRERKSLFSRHSRCFLNSELF